ncbi:MAG: AAA family ATPase [Planctomycetes bacterium]|nr:AAA family ATPase [Planctomycetota bacterium]
MVARALAAHARALARRYPVLAVTGPRQSGKTTFCRAEFAQHEYVSLEAPDERRFAREDPRGFLARFPYGAMLDEVQRAPDLLSYLQGMVDERPKNGRWILTGSQHFVLSRALSPAFKHLPMSRRSDPQRHGPGASPPAWREARWPGLKSARPLPGGTWRSAGSSRKGRRMCVGLPRTGLACLGRRRRTASGQAGGR